MPAMKLFKMLAFYKSLEDVTPLGQVQKFKLNQLLRVIQEIKVLFQTKPNKTKPNKT
jgi:hypothetical protein